MVEEPCQHPSVRSPGVRMERGPGNSAGSSQQDGLVQGPHLTLFILSSGVDFCSL